MRIFKDAAGRDWTLSVNAWTLGKVKKAAEVELHKLVDDGLRPLAELLRDCPKLVEVLWVLVEEQAKAAGISPEQFGVAMGGDALESASEAFVQALVDFLPQEDRRKALREVIAKSKQMSALAGEQAMAELAKFDPREEVAKSLEKRKVEAGEAAHG